MKNVCLLALLFFWVISTSAQKPEPIFSFARVQMPLDWYKTQKTLWKKQLDRKPKDGNAWYNYYRVSRNLNRCDTTDLRSMDEKDKDLQQLVTSMGKAIPNSYEYNLCKWMEGGNNPEYLPYLKKANELGEGHWEHLADVVIWGETERNLKRRDEACLKWKASGEVSTGMLNYNFNVLNGLPKNAILFTSGDNDTFPCWILQSMGVRRDVTVINTSLLNLDAYMKTLFSELGIEPMSLPKDAEGNLTQASFEKFNQDMIQHCTKNSKSLPVCVSLTTAGRDDFIKSIESNLYLTGLAYEFKTESMDNMAVMKRNFEQNYALDYLDKAFYDDISKAMVQEMNRNYLVPMMKLYEHYQLAGDLARQSQLKTRILAIGKGTKQESQIIEHLNKLD